MQMEWKKIEKKSRSREESWVWSAPHCLHLCQVCHNKNDATKELPAAQYSLKHDFFCTCKLRKASCKVLFMEQIIFCHKKVVYCFSVDVGKLQYLSTDKKTQSGGKLERKSPISIRMIFLKLIQVRDTCNFPYAIDEMSVKLKFQLKSCKCVSIIRHLIPKYLKYSSNTRSDVFPCFFPFQCRGIDFKAIRKSNKTKGLQNHEYNFHEWQNIMQSKCTNKFDNDFISAIFSISSQKCKQF